MRAVLISLVVSAVLPGCSDDCGGVYDGTYLEVHITSRGVHLDLSGTESLPDPDVIQLQAATTEYVFTPDSGLEHDGPDSLDVVVYDGQPELAHGQADRFAYGTVDEATFASLALTAN